MKKSWTAIGLTNVSDIYRTQKEPDQKYHPINKKKQINYTVHSQQKKYKQSVHICFKCLVSPLAIGEMKILAVIPLWVSGENKYEPH